MLIKGCIIYVLMLSGENWEMYPSADDHLMGSIESKEDCAKEAGLLLLRRGDIKKAYCVYFGDSRTWLLPPYEWPEPRLIPPTLPELLRRAP